ncbi:MAG TPA: hypothetical protein VER11_08395 [Polyangiaceae bacterium]|nr:hypothetical protein [Polyangiaceae bacterium]
MNRSTRARPESADPFAMQLALSRVHARLVPMQRDELGYSIDPIAASWLELPADRGFAGYGLSRALRMLLDVLRGLTALHDTFDAEGVDFAHGEVALPQLRVDPEGVCRLVPLTTRHSVAAARPPAEAVGHLAPERLLGDTVDARADVFSAGVLLWEALAGRRLFSETNADAIVERLMGEKLPMPQLPPELAWAIPLKSIAARALSVDPYQRFADCAELATAIAIVARERVATHSEIAAFFGPQLRSHGSVAQQRPIPTRSSTFPSVNLPVAPVSVSAPPSSRNGFPLATPSVRSSTPAPRSVTPAPRSVTPAPPTSSTSPRDPESQRNVNPKSPFATLIGVGEHVPASHRRKTLTSLGTPAAAIAPSEAAPASAPPSSRLPPPLPTFAGAGLVAPSPASRGLISSSAVVARSRLESIPLSDVAKFRSWSPRHSLIALGVVAVVALAIALIASLSSVDTPEVKPSNLKQTERAPIAAAAPVLPTPEPTPVAEDQTRNAPAPRATAEPSNAVPANNPNALRPSSKGALPSKPVSNTKDYGI